MTKKSGLSEDFHEDLATEHEAQAPVVPKVDRAPSHTRGLSLPVPREGAAPPAGPLAAPAPAPRTSSSEGRPREAPEAPPRQSRMVPGLALAGILGLVLTVALVRRTPTQTGSEPQSASSIGAGSAPRPVVGGDFIASGARNKLASSERTIMTGDGKASPAETSRRLAPKGRGSTSRAMPYAPPTSRVLPYFGSGALPGAPKRPYETFSPPAGRPMLMVFTSPSGVPVEVDGRLAGVTPLLRPVPAQTESVRVRLYGAAYKEQVATLKKDESGNFQLSTTIELKNPRPAPTPGRATAQRASTP